MSSLNPSTIAEVNVDKANLTYILGAIQNLTAQDVISLIERIEDEALLKTKTDIQTWINKKVPKRTSQLRDSLLKNLDSSRRNKLIVKLKLGTSLNYAEFVNAMTTDQVRHSGDDGYAYYYGNYGKITLDDPEAIGHFWDELLDFAIARFKLNLQDAIRNITGGIGVNVKPFNEILQVS